MPRSTLSSRASTPRSARRSCTARAAAGARRRRLGQDARGHAPDRVLLARQGGASTNPRHHLHQQGRGGDARARRALVGRAARAMWVMTFHSPAPVCSRRAAPARLHAPVHDLRRRRPAAADQVVPRRARHRRQALHAARDVGARSPTPRTSCAPPRIPRAHRLLLRADGGRRLRALRGELHRAQRDGLRRPAVPRGQPARALPGGPRPLPAFRYVLVDEYQDTNHAQYRWLQLLSRSTAIWRGRRRRAVDLSLPRGGHPEHLEFPGRLPRTPRQARAELPLDADDPRRRDG